MTWEKIDPIGVVGAGMIGCSLATLFLGNGRPVVLVARREESLTAGREEIARNFDDLIRRGYMSESQKEAALQLLTLSTEYEALSAAGYVMEAVYEDVSVKASVYERLEAICREDTVIASATSAISADVLAETVKRKERFLVAHPWNPPHMVPLVEVVRSVYTDERAVTLTRELFDGVGHKAVVLRKNIEGFVGNRLQHALFREALYLIEQGVVTAEEIDEVVMYGFGPRYSMIGPMEHYDCAGLPLQKQVESNLFPKLCSSDQLPAVLLDCLEAGKLGIKTQEGVLDWHGKDMDDFRERQRAPYFRFINWNFPEGT